MDSVTGVWWVAITGPFGFLFNPQAIFTAPLAGALGVTPTIAAVFALLAILDRRSSYGPKEAAGSVELQTEVPVIPARMYFWLSSFDITDSDARLVGFDGEHFHVGQETVHYRDVNLLELLADIEVNDAPNTVPHRPRYLHQRVDGSADLRFKDNPVIARMSRRCTFKMTMRGSRERQFTRYESPEPWRVTRLAESVGRLNRMLVAAAAGDLEAAFSEFDLHVRAAHRTSGGVEAMASVKARLRVADDVRKFSDRVCGRVFGCG